MLEVLKSVGGVPISLRPNEHLDFGKYYMGKGATWKFFLKNNSEHHIAYITDIHLEESYAVFKGPDTIDPMDTVQVSIKIKPRSAKDVDTYIKEELPQDNFHLKGDIGWGNYHSRFENE